MKELVITTITKLSCYVLSHQWTDWKEMVYSEGYYEEERWYTRTCKCCGKTEEKEVPCKS